MYTFVPFSRSRCHTTLAEFVSDVAFGGSINGSFNGLVIKGTFTKHPKTLVISEGLKNWGKPPFNLLMIRSPPDKMPGHKL